jgi:hypothetical protein
MNSRRTADPAIPNPDQRLERAELMRNQVGGHHHGQQAAASHQQARHMAAIAKEPSHHKVPSTYGRGCAASVRGREPFEKIQPEALTALPADDC